MARGLVQMLMNDDTTCKKCRFNAARRRDPIALSWAVQDLRNAHSLAAEKGELWARDILAAARSDVRHYLRQNYNDYGRRGLSNREGTNNRRWRKYLRERRPRIACGNVWEIVG